MPNGMSQTGIVIRIAVAVVCAGIAIWGVLPTINGRFHAGCITMVLVGGIGVAVCIWYPQVAQLLRMWWESSPGKGLLITAAAVVSVLCVLFAVVSGCMIAACAKQPSEDATVIVLGAALRGDRPSLSLRTRLEAALVYLEEHPKAVCIVSGGQGPDEICTEASVMQKWLVDRGIASERIYIEDRSTSTYENICHSRELIEQEGLSSQVAIVTQEFHQFRAQQFVKRAGLQVSGAVTAHTPWYLLGSYWIRDFAGVCHMILLGT